MSVRKTEAEVPDDVRVVPDGADSGVVDLTHEIEPFEAPVLDGATALTVGTSTLRRYRLVDFALIPIDVLCLAIALLAAHSLRFGFLPGQDYLVGMAVAAVVWVGVFHALGLYAPQHLSWLEEFRRTVGAVAVGIVIIILLTFWLDVYLSRSWMAITLGIAFGLEITARRVVRGYVRRLHTRESLTLRTLVVGRPDEASVLLRKLGKQGSGYLPLGFVDVTSATVASDHLSPIERVSRLRFVMRQYRPDCVFVASPMIGTKQMLAVMQAARQEGVLVRIYTHLSGVLASRVGVQHLGRGGVALTLRPAGLSASQRVVKRTMDLGLAGLALIVFSPILLAIALVVRVTSGSPVLFRQERVTEGNRTFWMYKFRTMANGEGEHEEAEADPSTPFFKRKGDPRTTRVGRWLRSSSLDELPQLFNVLLGDMSLVGPRPLPAEQVTANIELLGPRHEVRAGVTGWWQIHGRSDVDHEEAIRMDHFYIENWSPSLDVYVLLRTVGALLTRKGAY